MDRRGAGKWGAKEPHKGHPMFPILERRRIFRFPPMPAALPAYPTKVLLAWAEAISGHDGLRDWLMGSAYPELGVFCHALRNEETSRAWLRHHGHPHLMALLLGTEGEQEAIDWLRREGHPTLADMALAADNDEDALVRLMGLALGEHGDGLWAQIAVRIREVKNDIEDANNDVHRIDPN